MSSPEAPSKVFEVMTFRSTPYSLQPSSISLTRHDNGLILDTGTARHLLSHDMLRRMRGAIADTMESHDLVTIKDIGEADIVWKFCYTECLGLIVYRLENVGFDLSSSQVQDFVAVISEGFR